MIDKIVICGNSALLVYHNREPIRITTDEDIITFIRWFLNENTIPYAEFKSAVVGESEDTTEIDVDLLDK